MKPFFKAETKTAITRASDVVLWAGAILHTLLALSLLLILAFISPAHAEEDLSCGGRNLLTNLQTDNPKAYAKIAAEAEAIPNSTGLFWKVEKDGAASSYLFGTMHLSDPRVIDLPAGAAEAFAKADTLIVESDEVLDPQKAGIALLAQPELTMFTDGKSISDFLDPRQKEELETELKSRGVSYFAVSKMKPWMISSFVALPACELARKQAGSPFLDQKLALDAKAAGKKIVGLETMAEQLQIMSTLPMKSHIKGLVAMLEDPQRSKDAMETLIELYDQGKPGWVGPASEYLYPEDEAGFSMAEFEQKMVIARNHHMADRAAETLAKGNTFMAVGALHLPGEEGLVELLRAKGFTVSPL